MTPPGDPVGLPVMVPADPGEAVPVRRDRYGRLDWSETVEVTPESASDWRVSDWRDSP